MQSFIAPQQRLCWWEKPPPHCISYNSNVISAEIYGILTTFFFIVARSDATFHNVQPVSGFLLYLDYGSSWEVLEFSAPNQRSQPFLGYRLRHIQEQCFTGHRYRKPINMWIFFLFFFFLLDISVFCVYGLVSFFIVYLILQNC